MNVSLALFNEYIDIKIFWLCNVEREVLMYFSFSFFFGIDVRKRRCHPELKHQRAIMGKKKSKRESEMDVLCFPNRKVLQRNVSSLECEYFVANRMEFKWKAQIRMHVAPLRMKSCLGKSSFLKIAKWANNYVCSKQFCECRARIFETFEATGA